MDNTYGQNENSIQRPYAIICDIPAPTVAGVTIQVLVNRAITDKYWWTKTDHSEAFQIMNWSLAAETVRRFKHNHPRIISWADAVMIMNQQKELMNASNR